MAPSTEPKWLTRSIMLVVVHKRQEVYALAHKARCFGVLAVHPATLVLQKPREDSVSWFVETQHPPNRRLFQVTFIPSGQKLALLPSRDGARMFCEQLYQEYGDVLTAKYPRANRKKAAKMLTNHPRWDDFTTRMRELKERLCPA